MIREVDQGFFVAVFFRSTSNEYNLRLSARSTVKVSSPK
jgi:hypothetical protein